MMMVDSSVWIDFLRGVSTPQMELLTVELDRQTVIIGDLILAEVLQGIDDEREFRWTKTLMDDLPTLAIAGNVVSYRAVDHYRFLRKRGITVRKTIDTLIATRCILDGIPLLYSDRDFDPFVEHLGLQSALALS